MTINYAYSAEIMRIYEHWDKFSMLNLAHWYDYFDNLAPQHNAIRINSWPKFSSGQEYYESAQMRYCWRLNPRVVSELLEADDRRVALVLYESLSATDEQKLYLKMKWGFVDDKPD